MTEIASRYRHRRSRRPIARLLLTVCCLGIGAGMVFAQQPLRFEAEDVTEPSSAWNVDKFSETKWNLWSTDKDAERKWSEGVVLQSPRVLSDRPTPEAGAPPLHTVIRDVPPGKYYVEIGRVGRPMAISWDGETWQKIDSSSRNLGLVDIPAAGLELWVDDRYASDSSPGSCYYDYVQLTPLPDPNRKPKVDGFAQHRVEEQLDRGVVALPTGNGGVYVGWRLLKDDPKNVGFDVYRSVPGASRTKLNAAPLTRTTDFVDTAPVADVPNQYTMVIRPLLLVPLRWMSGQRC